MGCRAVLVALALDVAMGVDVAHVFTDRLPAKGALAATTAFLGAMEFPVTSCCPLGKAAEAFAQLLEPACCGVAGSHPPSAYLVFYEGSNAVELLHELRWTATSNHHCDMRCDLGCDL
jgi:hypothetical protein